MISNRMAMKDEVACEVMVIHEGRTEMRYCLDHEGPADWCPSPVVPPDAERRSRSMCGAQDWATDDDDEPFVYGTCEKPAGHEGRWHVQYTPSGQVWAEWAGSAAERAPKGARDGFRGGGPHDCMSG